MSSEPASIREMYGCVNPVTPFDVNATARYRPGIDHTKLTFKFAGRDFRLTDVEGTVIKELLS
jgi:hypothetical protein